MATPGTAETEARGTNRRWPSRPTHLLRLSPSRITAVYLVLGLTALVIFDLVLLPFLSDPTLRQVQAIKGAAEVVLTAGLIYWLSTHHERQQREVADRIDRERRELAVLHRVLRHNLRNDINVIIAATDMLRDRFDASGEPVECDRIDRITERIEAYTEDARRIRKVDEGPQEPREFDVAAIVTAVLEDPDASVESATGELTVPDSLPVRANYMLPQAIEELLNDVLRAEAGTTPTVGVSAQVDPEASDRVLLEIRGWGASISPADREAIERGDENDLVHATGLGLWFVAWTIERSDGDLEFVEHDDGTEVRISLPRAR